MKVRTITIGLALAPKDFIGFFPDQQGIPQYPQLAEKIAQGTSVVVLVLGLYPLT